MSLLLIENAATNLCINSQTVGGTSWTNTAITGTSNVAVAPDTTTTADKISETATTAQFFTSCTIGTVLIGDTYTFSVYAKAVENTTITLFESNAQNCIYDLAGGAILSAIGGANATMQPLSGGWYRVSATFIKTTTAGLFYIFLGSALSYLGTAGHGIYVWGAQVEHGATLTSYIPTSGTAVTRAADFLQIINNDLPYAVTLYALVLCALAQAIIDYTPPTSNEATAILAQYITLFDATIAPASNLSWITTVASLSELRSTVLQYLQQQVAIEPAVATQTFGDSLPDVVAAYALYGDATRADSLVLGNDPSNPLYMPSNVIYANPNANTSA